MGRGPKKHLKRTAAPRSWMLDKLSGSYAPKVSPGPHKSRECIPLIILLRNKLHYAMNGDEVKKILMKRYVKVDGKVRTDKTFPVGLMDVVQLEGTKYNIRILYDTKGRFTTHKVSDDEAKYKLLRVNQVRCGKGGIPYIVTHDGRTIRYPSPDIKVNDTVKFDLTESKIKDHYKFDNGSISIVTGGHNIGRVGTIIHKERHLGGFDIIHIKDQRGHTFATRISNVFVIGTNDSVAISLPKEFGIRYDIFEERDFRVKDDVPESATLSSSSTTAATSVKA